MSIELHNRMRAAEERLARLEERENARSPDEKLPPAPDLSMQGAIADEAKRDAETPAVEGDDGGNAHEPHEAAAEGDDEPKPARRGRPRKAVH